MDIEETLKNRGTVYGNYGHGLDIRSDLIQILRGSGPKSLTTRQIGYFIDICNKLARLAVTPDHLDSWHDIEGYARLIQADIRGDENEV